MHGAAYSIVQTNFFTDLGIFNSETGYYHPEGRKVAFLGDFIDPKKENDPDLPHDVPAVLRTVKAMADNDNAVAVMGNHEFNAIFNSTLDAKGKYFRPFLKHKDKGLKISISAFEGGFEGDEWKAWIDWFKTLPPFLELDGLSLVHAFWDQKAINAIGDRKLSDPDFLVKAATKNHHVADKGNNEYNWIENLLKGYELPMPDGHTYIDHTGIERDNFRARWFDLAPFGKLACELVFPAGNYHIPAAPVTEETEEKEREGFLNPPLSPLPPV